jgi:hypothetical protein
VELLVKVRVTSSRRVLEFIVTIVKEVVAFKY